MCNSTTTQRAAVVLAAWISTAACAHAVDLTGLWVTDVEACNKVFTTEGRQTNFSPDADLYGSGFIIDGTHIRGKMASCSIKSKKEDGNVLHLLAACATDIMLQNVQFSVKVVNDNRITRIFPGIDGMALDYYRCPARRGTP